MRVTDTARKPVIHGTDLAPLKDPMTMLARHSRQKVLCKNAASPRTGNEGRMEQDHRDLRVQRCTNSYGGAEA